MKEKIYSTKILRLIKIIALFAIVILFLAEIRKILEILNATTKEDKLSSLFIFILNFFVLIFFCISFFNPEKIEFFAIPAFIYSLPSEKTTPDFMWLKMFILGITILWTRGFFIRHKKTKICLLSLFLLIDIIGHILCNNENPLSFLLDVFGHSFVLFCICAFIIISLSKEEKQEDKILNIAKFKGIKDYDANLLQQILDGKLYKQLDCPESINVKSIRSHMNRIFKKIGVMDKTGFIASYYGYKIIYDKSSVTEMIGEDD